MSLPHPAKVMLVIVLGIGLVFVTLVVAPLAGLGLGLTVGFNDEKREQKVNVEEALAAGPLEGWTVSDPRPVCTINLDCVDPTVVVDVTAAPDTSEKQACTGLTSWLGEPALAADCTRFLTDRTPSTTLSRVIESGTWVAPGGTVTVRAELVDLDRERPACAASGGADDQPAALEISGARLFPGDPDEFTAWVEDQEQQSKRPNPPAPAPEPTKCSIIGPSYVQDETGAWVPAPLPDPTAGLPAP